MAKKSFKRRSGGRSRGNKRNSKNKSIRKITVSRGGIRI